MVDALSATFARVLVTLVGLFAHYIYARRGRCLVGGVSGAGVWPHLSRLPGLPGNHLHSRCIKRNTPRLCLVYLAGCTFLWMQACVNPVDFLPTFNLI